MKIILQSGDGKKFTVPKDVALQSGLVDSMVDARDLISLEEELQRATEAAKEAAGTDAFEGAEKARLAAEKALNEAMNDDDPIPLPNVDSAILESILTYCKHHANNPGDIITKPVDTKNLLSVGVTQPDIDFIEPFVHPRGKGSLRPLVRLMEGASYMENPRLLNLCCVRMVAEFSDMTEVDIRLVLDMDPDGGFTKEEWAAVLQETAFIQA